MNLKIKNVKSKIKKNKEKTQNSKIQKISYESIDKNVLKKGITILHVYDDVIGPGIMSLPPLQEISLTHKVLQINFWESFPFIKKEKLRSIRPVIIIYVDGKKEDTLYGLKSKEEINKHLEKFWNEQKNPATNIEKLKKEEINNEVLNKVKSKKKSALSKKIKNVLGDKFNLNKKGEQSNSNIYEAMQKANPKWKKTLDKDSASFRKTDNAMTMLYYFLFSMLVMQLSNIFLMDILNQYYVFMIDWILLLSFSLSLQFLLKVLRGFSIRTMLMQDAQIVIITLFSMLLAFVVNVVQNELVLSKVWMYVVTAIKTASLFIITTFIFSAIQKVHSKMVAATQERLWYIAINNNTSKSSEQLVKSVSFTLGNMVQEIADSLNVDRSIIIGLLTELSDGENPLKDLIKSSSKAKKTDLIIAEHIAYYWQALSGYLDNYMNGDYYNEISLGD